VKALEQALADDSFNAPPTIQARKSVESFTEVMLKEWKLNECSYYRIIAERYHRASSVTKSFYSAQQ